MSLLTIPLQAVPDQTVQVYLAGQNCTLRCYQRRYGYFVDLYLNNVPVRYGMEAHNLYKIIRDEYLGVVGNFYFYDTQGFSDPQYAGVGSRYVLLYDASL